MIKIAAGPDKSLGANGPTRDESEGMEAWG